MQFYADSASWLQRMLRQEAPQLRAKECRDFERRNIVLQALTDMFRRLLDDLGPRGSAIEATLASDAS